MTAYELRRHLAAQHAFDLRGAAYETLLAVHDAEHRPGVAQDHEHHDGD